MEKDTVCISLSEYKLYLLFQYYHEHEATVIRHGRYSYTFHTESEVVDEIKSYLDSLEQDLSKLKSQNDILTISNNSLHKELSHIKSEYEQYISRGNQIIINEPETKLSTFLYGNYFGRIINAIFTFK